MSTPERQFSGDISQFSMGIFVAISYFRYPINQIPEILLISPPAPSAKKNDQPQQLGQGNSGGSYISHGSGFQSFLCALLFFVGQNSGVFNGGNGTAAGIEFHRQGHQLEYQRKTRK